MSTVQANFAHVNNVLPRVTKGGKTTLHSYDAESLGLIALIEATWSDGVLVGTTCHSFRFIDSHGDVLTKVETPDWRIDRILCNAFESEAGALDWTCRETMQMRHPSPTAAAAA